MPRRCTICQHEQAFSINLALRGGEALRDIARRYGTSKTTLARHALHAGIIPGQSGPALDSDPGTAAPVTQAIPQAVPQPEHVPEQSGTGVPLPAAPVSSPGQAVPGHASTPVVCPLCAQSDRLEQPGCRGDYRCARCGLVFAQPRAAVAIT